MIRNTMLVSTCAALALSVVAQPSANAENRTYDGSGNNITHSILGSGWNQSGANG